MTTAEAAKVLRCTKRQISQLFASGALAGRKAPGIRGALELDATTVYHYQRNRRRGRPPHVYAVWTGTRYYCEVLEAVSADGVEWQCPHPELFAKAKIRLFGGPNSGRHAE